MVRNIAARMASARGRQRTVDDRPRIDAAHLRRQALGDAALTAEILRIFVSRLEDYPARLREEGGAGVLAEHLRLLALAAEGVGAFVLAAAAQEAQRQLADGSTTDIEALLLVCAETAREARRMIARAEH